jgi:hypothetical protein
MTSHAEVSILDLARGCLARGVAHQPLLARFQELALSMT